MSLLLRYVVAVVVAFAASMTTMILSAMLAGSLHPVADGSALDWFVPTIDNALIGLAGVFLGALCLPRPNRVSGAFILASSAESVGRIRFWQAA